MALNRWLLLICAHCAVHWSRLPALRDGLHDLRSEMQQAQRLPGYGQQLFAFERSAGALHAISQLSSP
jgi:hypothetical protein